MCRNTRFIYTFRVLNMKISCQHTSQTDNLWLLQLQWLFSTLSSAMSSDTELNHFQVLFFFASGNEYYSIFFSLNKCDLIYVWIVSICRIFRHRHVTGFEISFSPYTQFRYGSLFGWNVVVYDENYSISLINSKIVTRLARYDMYENTKYTKKTQLCMECGGSNNGQWMWCNLF